MNTDSIVNWLLLLVGGVFTAGGTGWAAWISNRVTGLTGTVAGLAAKATANEETRRMLWEELKERDQQRADEFCSRLERVERILERVERNGGKH